MRLSIKHSVLILSFIGLCAAHTSCTKEIATEEPYYQEVTIAASADGDIKTKTERQADGKVFWTPGDAISIFYGSGTNGGSRFTSTNTETAAIANFTGKIGVITGGGEISLDEIYFWGVYPYRDDNSCDGTSITTYLPAEQEGVADTFADDLFPTMGRNLGLSLAFYNICGGIRFSVARDDIRSITFRGNNGEVLAGRVKVIMQNGAPVVSQVLEPETEITLTAPDGGCFEVGKYYYMVALPADLNNGFTMTLETDNQTGTREMTSKVSIKRSSFGSLNSVDSKATFTEANVQFEDANFKAYCVENFDTDGDGEISMTEAETVTIIKCNRKGISSLEGIQCFTSLMELECDGNQLSYLNLSSNTKLVAISCVSNKIGNLILNCSSTLQQLFVRLNDLDELSIEDYSALNQLDFGNNHITSIDIRNLSELTHLRCSSNGIDSLDVRYNNKLIWLDCQQNSLTTLDVTQNEHLNILICGRNSLSELDVNFNPELTELGCGNNQIINLDISNNQELKELYCNNNRLSVLDVRNSFNLVALDCYSNSITDLDVSNCRQLTQLKCHSNFLTNLDLTNNPKLRLIFCDSNKLTDLRIGECPGIMLSCYANCLSNLDISHITDLLTLDCSPMNVSLDYLYINENQKELCDYPRGNKIPSETEIVIVGTPGGSEDIETEIW